MKVGLISCKPAQYVINNSLLHSITSSTDLGVKMSSNLSFSEHINSIMVKAKFRSNHIIRCFLSKDCNLLTQAFITYVRPLLEYCSPVWSLSYVTLINTIESVQRFFTNRLNGLQSISYDDL